VTEAGKTNVKYDPSPLRQRTVRHRSSTGRAAVCGAGNAEICNGSFCLKSTERIICRASSPATKSFARASSEMRCCRLTGRSIASSGKGSSDAQAVPSRSSRLRRSSRAARATASSWSEPRSFVHAVASPRSCLS